MMNMGMESDMMIGDEEIMLVGDDFVVAESDFNKQKEDENNNAFVKIEDDPRVTKVGKFIRKFSIDELPQLFNILKGDMSIVGPRCEMVENVEKYTKEIPEFKYSHKVKAGLTGYAQVYGKYNTTAYDKLKLDLYYIENYSLRTDLRIILMTIKILFMRESTEEFTEENHRYSQRYAHKYLK
jgi:lipopolysaccharide/colanic/teichoic acid biosynthesis glycosyltransferase